MTVTLMVNSVASVGFMIIPFQFRLSFPLCLLSPLHRLRPLISHHGPKSLSPSGELLKDIDQLPSSTPPLDAWPPR